MTYRHFNHYKRRMYKGLIKKDRDWDFSYIIQMLITKLTVMGIYLFNFSHLVNYRESVHEIWLVRRELKLYENSMVLDKLLENNVKYTEAFLVHEHILSNAFSLLNVYIRNWWD